MHRGTGGDAPGRCRCLLAAVLLIPLVADGFIQLLTPYESTNPRRFVTGLAFGYGFLALFLYSCLAAYRFGYSLTH